MTTTPPDKEPVTRHFMVAYSPPTCQVFKENSPIYSPGGAGAGPHWRASTIVAGRGFAWIGSLGPNRAPAPAGVVTAGRGRAAVLAGGGLAFSARDSVQSWRTRHRGDPIDVVCLRV